MLSTTSLRDFGFTYLGPLLAQYFQRLQSEVAPNTIVLCLAREGFLFRRITCALQDDGFLQLQNAPLYVKVSRLVLFRAACASPSLHNLSVATMFEGSLRSFLQGRLGLAARFVDQEFSAKELAKNIKLPGQSNEILALLGKHVTALAAETADTAAALNAYLDSLNLHRAPGKLLCLDLGFSGTIQQLLTSFLQRDTHGLYIMASNPGRQAVGPWTAHMAGSFSEGLRIGDGYRPVDRSLFFECLLTAPHGPVMDISQKEDGSFSFVYGPSAAGQRQHHALEQVFAGATEAVMHAFRHGIQWSKNDLELLIERQVRSLWNIPEPVRSLFTADDSICGNGLISPIQFHQL